MAATSLTSLPSLPSISSHFSSVDANSSSLFRYSPPSFPSRRLRAVFLPASVARPGPPASVSQEEDADGDAAQQALRGAADWKKAQAYKDSGAVFNGRVEASNNGGLRIRFHSLLGFLPYPLLSPGHGYKEPQKAIHDIGKDIVGTYISVKIIEANEEEKKLIFSEKDVYWSKYVTQLKIGDVFDAMVAGVGEFGAIVYLPFPDGCCHLTGFVHVSEVSWDLVQHARDFLRQGDMVKVKIIQIDMEKSRISVSIKQLEDDPLLETLDKVIPLEGDQAPDALATSTEPLAGLENICKELLQEDGILDVQLGRQALEKRVVSQDLELWLSNAPAKDKQFTLLARAGRQVQEVYLKTTLDQEGIKKAVQRVVGRVP